MCVCLSAQRKLVVNVQTSWNTKRVMEEDGQKMQGLCTVKQSEAPVHLIHHGVAMFTWHKGAGSQLSIVPA